MIAEEVGASGAKVLVLKIKIEAHEGLLLSLLRHNVPALYVYVNRQRGNDQRNASGNNRNHGQHICTATRGRSHCRARTPNKSHSIASF